MPRGVLSILKMARHAGVGPVRDSAAYSCAPCTDCAAPCCATLRARVTMTEAVRIANGLAVPVDDVVERVPGADGHHPWFTIPIPLEDGLETLALRRTSHGSCRFLLGVGSRGRCAIHPMRAGVCRLFPYEVDYGGRRYSVGDQSLCPKAWLVDKDSPRRVQRDLEAWLTDLAAEEDLVARWSRRSRGARSWSAWVAFARRHGT